MTGIEPALGWVAATRLPTWLHGVGAAPGNQTLLSTVKSRLPHLAARAA